MHYLIRITLCILLAATAAFSTGCVGSSFPSGEAPARHYYALSPTRTALDAGQSTNGTVKISRLSVSPSFSSRELVYKTGENTLVADYYNVFLVQPEDFLAQSLRDWISASNIFATVTTPGTSLDPDYIIEGEAQSLYGDFSQKNNPAAVVRLQLFLLQDTQVSYRVLLNKTYEVREPMNQQSPTEMVTALNKALGKVFAEFEVDAIEALKKQ